jgi:hypothetical protein
MAIPSISLDLLEHFSPVILFLFVFLIVYGIFEWAKILGENRAMHVMIAFLASFFVTVFSPTARDMVKFAIPWFLVLAIFIVLGIMIYKIFGATDADIRTVIKEYGYIQWTLFVVIAIIILIAGSQAFGQAQLGITNPNGSMVRPGDVATGDGSTASGSFNQNLGATFYHPKVIGTLFLLLVSAMAVAFLARK